MLFKLLILFFSAFFCGSIGFFSLFKQKKIFSLILIFSGGYLFAITILHILPDLFFLHGDGKKIGFYILLGFFLQLFLEFFSKGIEHGHIHYTKKNINIYTLLIALCIHAFFDGFILTDCYNHSHLLSKHKNLFWGIILHKAPVAFVLVTFFITYNKKS